MTKTFTVVVTSVNEAHVVTVLNTATMDSDTVTVYSDSEAVMFVAQRIEEAIR